jgi:hypothetical protein
VPVLRLGLLLVAVVAIAGCGGSGTGAGHDGGVDVSQLDLGARDGQSDAGLAADAGADAGGDAAADGGSDTAGANAADGGDAAADSGASDAAGDSGPPDDGPRDTGPLPTDTGAGDRADAGPAHVDIYISNTCVTTVVPASFSVPAGSALMLDFHNNSQWYAADVWCSFGGGYLDLATGAIWHNPIPFCSMTSVHDEYVDISIAGGPTSGCPGFRLWIHCQ